ncbi:MAG TPA: CotY/CotZ family spore coat protein, partial [Bacillota bacterium]|nr:CotY/CotZ family spore coat protein [Bacillota bacterium]
NGHDHGRGDRRCGCRHEHERDRWCGCGCHDRREVHHVCRELARILKDQRHPKHHDCGCTASIQQLRRSRVSRIIPFMLMTRNGRLFVEWGRQRHHSYATVFFSVIRVNCRYNEAVLELLKPNQSITDPRTGRVDGRRIREVDYVVPTGERIWVDLKPMREVRRLPQDFVRRYR